MAQATTEDIRVDLTGITGRSLRLESTLAHMLYELEGQLDLEEELYTRQQDAYEAVDRWEVGYAAGKIGQLILHIGWLVGDLGEERVTGVLQRYHVLCKRAGQPPVA